MPDALMRGTMTLVARNRRPRPTGDAGRTTVSDLPQPDAGELANLLEMLAAAGVQEDELLRALDRPGGTEKLLERLVEAGLLVSREESTAGLISAWKPLLKRGCDQWSAELAGLEFLAMVREAAGDDVPELLSSLISQAHEYGGPEALAMLRVLAVVGPPRSRPTAAKAADDLAASGVPDPAWVRGLGAPAVGPCFGYTDAEGVQQALVVTFAYGRKRHALAVLIDHERAGGIKDCWPTDDPDLVRADYQRAAERYGLHVRDYDPGEARTVLDRALAAPPCPVAPDQVEDVRDYLPLLRLRTALLPGAGTATIGPSRGSEAPTVHRVKITLRGARPPVWRRLEVPSDMTLRRLHGAIRSAFGWEHGRTWVFGTPAGTYGVADRRRGHRSAQSTRLADVAPRVRDLIHYTYGAGDGGQHEILVEAVLVAEPGVAYPRCVAGRRALPSAGDGFDLDEVNEALSVLAVVPVKG